MNARPPAQKGRKVVLHASRIIKRGTATRFTTVCGRMNAASRDGMNIAETETEVTCKFCLRVLGRARGAA